MAEIKPQPGPQERFLSSKADIAIYGGAAGGGKSFALLLEPLRHVTDPLFRAVLFRRTGKQIRVEGGLWDASRQIYGALGAAAKETDLLWRFPSGATISCGYMEHEKNRFDWQGTEITYIGFDELTHFSQNQFFYLLSRNRSMAAIRPYIRATCNPDADSWVAGFVRWWIDPETGYADPTKSGKIRWFVRDGNDLVWGDCPEDLLVDYPDQVPKSVTFVAASVDDNAILMARDAGYKSNLAALDRVERERLLHGNWKIRPAAGYYFKRSWFSMTRSIPVTEASVRGWDLAATAETERESGDWTVGAKVSRDTNGGYIVEHVERFKGSPAEVEARIETRAREDGQQVQIALPQDPGQAGKAQAASMVRRLSGFRVRATAVTGSKVTRAAPFSAQVEGGNVRLLEGNWNESFINELEGFPSGRHDDQVDAVVEAFNALNCRKIKQQQEMF
ncbi:phage terminase large subunit [Sneathiella aquimaris]|uniref:phage terminase large subunit n=1 Tax=Sneathiella aquimaris TaxID=2599305 RepID=UPI00146B29F5|nr:phage terminase large subunit [Sneathiella aquimaris]